MGDIFKKKETLEAREGRALESVFGIWDKYGQRLRSAYEGEDEDAFYKIVEEEGFKVKEVPLGSQIQISEEMNEIIERGNSVRIGYNNTLYVGYQMFGEEKRVNIDDLQHDVSACLTGGKNVNQKNVEAIRLGKFNEWFLKKTGMSYSEAFLDNIGLLEHDDRGQEYIRATYLLDSLVLGNIMAPSISRN